MFETMVCYLMIMVIIAAVVLVTFGAFSADEQSGEHQRKKAELDQVRRETLRKMDRRSTQLLSDVERKLREAKEK